MHKQRRLSRMGLLVVLCLMTLGVAAPVSADAGPKPTMEFQIKYDIDSKPDIESVVLLECNDQDCRNAAPLEEAGPQGISCYEDICDSTAYGYADYFILQLTFADGVTRESNIFTKTNFMAYYTVTVTENDLAVRQTGGMGNPFALFLGGIVGVGLTVVAGILLILIAVRATDTEVLFKTMPVTFIAVWILSIIGAINGVLIMPTMPLTFILEASIIIGYAVNQKEAYTPWLTVVLLANLITQPLLIGALLINGGAGKSYWLTMGIAEVLIVAAEMGIFKLCKRENLGWVQALIISLLINAASFGIGLVLPI